MNEIQKKQVAMHKDFFDRCNTAIVHGFYMEAILLEYAAMESRLEIILGVLGLPCNKFLEPDLRRKTKISHRISCLEYMYKHSPVFVKSCMKKEFFKKIKTWIKKRNQYIHSLYKNEIAYDQRIDDLKTIAEDGRDLCKTLYNETKRIRRMCEDTPELLAEGITCRSKGCSFCPKA